MEMPIQMPTSAPDVHRMFVARALPVLQADHRIVGVAAAGSWADDSMDEHSDLDLVIGVQSSMFDEVMADRQRIASTLGHLVASFSGEHVGEPRLLICLYADPLLHVDLKFIDADRTGGSVDRPALLWGSQAFSDALRDSFTGYPPPDEPWLEHRFWTWIHYGAAKVRRGELYEAIDLITFLRSRVLGPLILASVGEKPAGVRRLERAAPDWSRRLERTVARHAPDACLDALRACAEIYRELRPSLSKTPLAEEAAMEFVGEASAGLSPES